MKYVVKILDKMWKKEKNDTKREAKTKRYAREVIGKYEKTLRRLSYE